MICWFVQNSPIFFWKKMPSPEGLDLFEAPWIFDRRFSRWWFQISLCSSLPGEMIQIDSYSSNGLKPPTSFLYHFSGRSRYSEYNFYCLLEIQKPNSYKTAVATLFPLNLKPLKQLQLPKKYGMLCFLGSWKKWIDFGDFQLFWLESSKWQPDVYKWMTMRLYWLVS